MYNFKKILTSVILSFLVLTPIWSKENHRIEVQPIALEQAYAISSQGILKQKENGFVYLDVPNEFIQAVAPLLDMPGNFRPIPTSARSMGAHISVFDENEKIVPAELNTEFPFEVKEIRSFTLSTRDGLKKLWVIAVNAPKLEKLREKYGLPAKMKGHEYHITLGKQIPGAPENWQSITHLSPLNFDDEPTLGISQEGDYETVEHTQILATAAKVDAVAQLKLKGNGFVYLNVDNQFIDEVWQQLPISGKFTPLSTSPKQMGAHISVIEEDEMIAKEIWNLAEAGEWFNFEVKALRYVESSTSNGKKRLWMLAADAPGLERLRKQYGLRPKLKNHDFHITIGTELIETPSQN